MQRFNIRAIPAIKTGIPMIDICAANVDEPYARVTFHDDPTITVFPQYVSALTVIELIAALELAAEFVRNGPDWRPAE